MADIPTDNYDDLSAVEVIESIENESYTDDELLAIKSYESDTKDRVTVRRAVDAQLADDESTDTETSTMSTDDPTDRDQLRPSEDDRDVDDEPTEPEPEGGPAESTVRVRLGHKGHAAGHYFESPREIAELPMNRRTQLALEDGTLTRVE